MKGIIELWIYYDFEDFRMFFSSFRKIGDFFVMAVVAILAKSSMLRC